MRPHVPHMQDADELYRLFPSLHSHCLLLRCNLAHSIHAMISLRKSLSSHPIRPCRSAAPKDSKDREDDDTSRSRLLLILDLLAHRAIARQAKPTDLSEPQSLVITQSEQGALSECESLTTSCSSTLTSRSKAPRQDRTDPSPADTALFQQIFIKSSCH